MRRAVHLLGSLLMVGGIAILVYVGISYERSKTASKSPTWSTSQRDAGRRIAKELSHHQKIAVPRPVTSSGPAPGSEVAIRLVIPKIRVDAPVVETPPVNGVWQVADWAVGHLSTTPNPGGVGNDALSAHDDIKGEIFKRLGELAPGDQVLVYTRHARFTYVITSESTVDPTNVSVLNPTSTATVTLISCSPYWVDSQRLIVQGTLKTQTAA